MKRVLISTVIFFSISPVRSVFTQDSQYIRAGHPQYFSVLVKDAETAVKWYVDVFALKKIGGSKADNDAWQIENLRGENLMIEIIRDNRAEFADRPLGFGKVGFFVDDLEKTAAIAELKTGEKPRILDFPQMKLRLLQLRDPEGNTIQIMSDTKGESGK